MEIHETLVYVTVHTEFSASYTINTTYVPDGGGSIGSSLTNNWAPIGCGGGGDD